MKRELDKMQGFVDRMGAKASKATQAQDRLKKIEKLEAQMVLPAFAEAEGGRGPALTLARPPPVGQWPLTLTGASFGYASTPTDDGLLVSPPLPPPPLPLPLPWGANCGGPELQSACAGD